MTGRSPTARALELCRANGWEVDIAEKWIARAKIRKDLFGWIDLVVLDGKPGVLGVQVTSRAGMSARLRKIQEERGEVVKAWLAAGGRAEVWGCRVVKVEGQRKHQVEWRVAVVSGDKLMGRVVDPPPRRKTRRKQQVELAL